MHDPVSVTDDGSEYLGRVLIESDDGLRLDIEAAWLRTGASGPVLSGEDVLLLTPDARSGASALSVSVTALAWYLGKDGTAPLTASVELRDPWVEMIRGALGGGERLSAGALALGPAGNGLFAFSLRDVAVTTPAGDSLGMRRLLANLPEELLAGEFGELDGLGLEVEGLLAARADGGPILRFDRAGARISGRLPEPLPASSNRLETVVRIYQAIASAEIRGEVSLEGLHLPLAGLLPGEMGAALSALDPLAGSTAVRFDLAQGQLSLDFQQQMQGAFDATFRLSARMQPFTEARLAEFDEGADPELSDLPSISLKAFSVSFRDKGLDRILVAAGLLPLADAIRSAADPMLDGAGQAEAAARQVVDGVAGWFANGTARVVCAGLPADAPAMELAELAVVAALSPDLAASRLRVTEQCG